MTRPVAALAVVILALLASGIAVVATYDGEDLAGPAAVPTPGPTTPGPTPTSDVTPAPTPSPTATPGPSPGPTLSPGPTPTPTTGPQVGATDPRDLDDTLPHTGGAPLLLGAVLLVAAFLVRPRRRSR